MEDNKPDQNTNNEPDKNLDGAADGADETTAVSGNSAGTGAGTGDENQKAEELDKDAAENVDNEDYDDAQEDGDEDQKAVKANQTVAASNTHIDRPTRRSRLGSAVTAMQKAKDDREGQSAMDLMPDDPDKLKQMVMAERHKVMRLNTENSSLQAEVTELKPLARRVKQTDAVLARIATDSESKWKPVLGLQITGKENAQDSVLLAAPIGGINTRALCVFVTARVVPSEEEGGEDGYEFAGDPVFESNLMLADDPTKMFYILKR